MLVLGLGSGPQEHPALTLALSLNPIPNPNPDPNPKPKPKPSPSPSPGPTQELGYSGGASSALTVAPLAHQMVASSTQDLIETLGAKAHPYLYPTPPPTPAPAPTPDPDPDPRWSSCTASTFCSRRRSPTARRSLQAVAECRGVAESEY